MTAIVRVFISSAFCFFLFGITNGQDLTNRSPVGPFLNGAFPETTPPTGANGGAAYTTVEPFPDLEINTVDLIQLLPVPNSSQLLLADKRGKIFTFDDRPDVTTLTQLLDLQPQTQWDGDSGLLGVAIHPGFGQGIGKDDIFVYYRYRPFDPNEVEGGLGFDENGEANNQKAYMRLSRFSWTPGSDTITSPEIVLINQYDPHNWHNGGGLAFGDDGFLYLTVGDAGGGNDEFDTSQTLEEGLFSGVLRIDVDEDASRSHPIRRQPIDPVPRPDTPRFAEGTYTANYFIPNDNPWQDVNGGILEEFYAVGLRSPHRMTYDSPTGTFWIGDVGQVDREEISVLDGPGANFQWPFREGDIAGPKPRPPASVFPGSDVEPYFAYDRAFGATVVGGYVYRGSLNPELHGKYIFCEFSKGEIYSLDPGGDPNPTLLTNVTPTMTLSFGIDHDGELFLLQRGVTVSSILKLVPSESSGEPDTTPRLLSETGAFSDMTTLAPGVGVVPYDVIQPLWSDGAGKGRWMVIPSGPGVTDDKITYSETGNWRFPVGTVLIKHFEIEGLRLETRFSVKGADEEWYLLTYRWNEAQTDAELLTSPAGITEELQVNGRDFTWHFPSRTECFLCHTETKGRVLGIQTRHTNLEVTDLSSGQQINLLAGLSRGGFFTQPIDESSLPDVLTATAISDASASLESRVRSYLDINCSQCHTEGGTAGRVQIEADMLTPLSQQNLINAIPLNDLGLPGDPRIIKPGDEALSILYQRMNTADGCCPMPPLARNEVDTEAVTVLVEWIRGLDPDDPGNGGGPGPNLLTNTGFEEGLTGWNTWFAEGNPQATIELVDLAIEGVQAVRISEEAMIQQTATAESGQTLRLTGSYATTGSASFGADVGFVWIDSDGAEMEGGFVAERLSGTGGTFDLFSFDAVVPDGAATVLIFAYAGAGGSITLDDVSLSTVSGDDGDDGDPPGDGGETNLLANNGFEGGLADWNTWLNEGNPQAIVELTDAASEGLQAVRVGEEAMIQHIVSVEPGVTYQFSGSYATFGNSAFRANVGFDWFTATGDRIDEAFSSVELANNAGSFDSFSVSSQAPDEAATLLVFVYAGAGGSVVVDDFSLIALDGTGNTGGTGDTGDTGGSEDSNLLLNPGFESGLDGWRTWFNEANEEAQIGLVLTASEGIQAAEITEEAMIQQVVAIDAGEPHQLSGSYATFGAESFGTDVGFAWFDASGAEIDEAFSAQRLANNEGIFETFSINTEAPATAETLLVFVYVGAGGSVIVDDLDLRKSIEEGTPDPSLIVDTGETAGSTPKAAVNVIRLIFDDKNPDIAPIVSGLDAQLFDSTLSTDPALKAKLTKEYKKAKAKLKRAKRAGKTNLARALKRNVKKLGAKIRML